MPHLCAATPVLHSLWKRSSGEHRSLLGISSPDELLENLPSWRSQVPENRTGGDETVSFSPLFHPKHSASRHSGHSTCWLTGAQGRFGEGLVGKIFGHAHCAGLAAESPVTHVLFPVKHREIDTVILVRFPQEKIEAWEYQVTCPSSCIHGAPGSPDFPMWLAVPSA